MDDDGVTDGNVLDSGTDGVHPASILMAEDVGELDVALVLPLAFDDMEVGPAKPRAADAHDDIVRPGDLRIGHFFELGALAVGMQADSFHGYFVCNV
jgi:hypothetical protein